MAVCDASSATSPSEIYKKPSSLARNKKPGAIAGKLNTMNGIIFITDRYCHREVTACSATLAFMLLDPKAVEDHEKAKHILACKPHLFHSRYILTIDNSGSMTSYDVTMHRDRQVAAYTTTALKLIAEQLIEQTANNRYVVSLIEFSDTARVVFTGEPMSWVLFNKVLARRDERTYRERQHAKKMELLQCDSNYLPALDAVKELLRSSSSGDGCGGGILNHVSCALSLLFLSDGAPSDARHYQLTTDQRKDRWFLAAPTRGTKEFSSSFGHINVPTFAGACS